MFSFSFQDTKRIVTKCSIIFYSKKSNPNVPPLLTPINLRGSLTNYLKETHGLAFPYCHSNMMYFASTHYAKLKTKKTLGVFFPF